MGLRVTQAVVRSVAMLTVTVTWLRAESTSSTLGSWWKRRLLFSKARLGCQSLVIPDAPCSCII